MVAMRFNKDKDGWFLAIPSLTRKEAGLIFNGDELLDMMDTEKDNTLVIYMEPSDGVRPNQKLIDQGFSGLIKQAEAPSGGCVYVVPSYEGNYINHHVWLNESISGYFKGAFPNVLYFK